MKRTVLALIDFSACSYHAAEFAVAICQAMGADLLLYHAFHTLPAFNTETAIFPYYQDYQALGNDSLSKLQDVAARLQSGLRKRRRLFAHSIHVATGPGTIGACIGSLVEERHPWLTVMGGERGQGLLYRVAYGSGTRTVIDKCNCPLLLVPQRAALGGFRKIIFASSLLTTERHALRFVLELAGHWTASITVAHVTQPGMGVADQAAHERAFDKLVKGFEARVKIEFVDLTGVNVVQTFDKQLLRSGNVVLAVVHKKRSLVGNMLFASVTKQATDLNRVPVLVLSRPQRR